MKRAPRQVRSGFKFSNQKAVPGATPIAATKTLLPTMQPFSVLGLHISFNGQLRWVSLELAAAAAAASGKALLGKMDRRLAATWATERERRE